MTLHTYIVSNPLVCIVPKHTRDSPSCWATRMAGAIRHPIDVKSLEGYIEQSVPEIKTPIEIKQVSPIAPKVMSKSTKMFVSSSATASQIPHTFCATPRVTNMSFERSLPGSSCPRPHTESTASIESCTLCKTQMSLCQGLIAYAKMTPWSGRRSTSWNS